MSIYRHNSGSWVWLDWTFKSAVGIPDLTGSVDAHFFIPVWGKLGWDYCGCSDTNFVLLCSVTELPTVSLPSLTAFRRWELCLPCLPCPTAKDKDTCQYPTTLYLNLHYPGAWLSRDFFINVLFELQEIRVWPWGERIEI